MELNIIFQIAGAGVLAAFFIIFFGKMVAQRRQGMRTGLFKRDSKSKRVFITEMILKVFVFAIFTAQIASIALDTHLDLLPLRIAGAIVAIAGVAVLGVAIRTMADSWRTEIPEGERTRLVTGGIFRISRNPAFLGFDLMFIGFVAMFFNPVLAALTLCGIVMYHLQILREEKFLTATFGTQYTDYMNKTRRYLGTKKAK
jgi:protein-S-isoprenylcysteine O-methyltransferase Ste14